MGRKVIELKYPATCRACGAALEVGARAVYYGRGRVYGRDCHERPETLEPHRPARYAGAGALEGPPGLVASKLDPTGFFTAAGELIGRRNPAGVCEDAPCRGCCS